MAQKREPKFKPVAGLVLADAENPARVVRLVYRFNPKGKAIPPYWVVKNLVTGDETTVIESELTHRYNVPPETADAPDAEPVSNPGAQSASDADPVVVNDPAASAPDRDTVVTDPEAEESTDGAA